jgi:hypothetical protein
MDRNRARGARQEDRHVDDSPPHPETADEAGVGPQRGPSPGTPRWVKVSGVIALILVLLVGGLMLFGGGGQHGPGRHAPAGGQQQPGGQTPPVGVSPGQTPTGGDPGGHAPPPGGH